MALFGEVAKALDFRRAEDVAGMPTSTLSRRNALLEQFVGLRLLNRTKRRIELTEVGQIYFDCCKRIFEEARIAHEELGGLLDQATGLIRISAPPDFGSHWLARVLKDFVALYPGITFDLDLKPRKVDLVADPFDPAIRMATPGRSHLISRVIGRMTPRRYAAPAYIAAHGAPAHPDDLEKHQCLTMNMLPNWPLHSGRASVTVPVSARVKADNVAMLRQLAGQGLGIVNLPESAVAQELASGALLDILPGWQGTTMAIHAVTETKLLPARTQRFIEFLKERFES